MRLLVVEDEPYIRQGIVEVLREEGFDTVEAASVTAALAGIKSHAVDAILCDNFLPDGEGFDVLESIQGTGIALILMTSFGNRELASRALLAGAYDYVTKPIRFDELLARLHRLQEKLTLRLKVKESEQVLQNQGELAVLGSSENMQAVQHLIQKSSSSQVPVLLQGETGVGKGVVARLLHSLSNRSAQPFVRINCASIPTELLESELFGHKKGSFSSADRDRKGLLATAGKGTLFMDELIELPLAMQSKLLHVFDEGCFRAVGDDKEQLFQARVIAASNVDFKQAIQEGRFREDLYFRLNVMEICIPPLRERGGDIIPLTARLLEQICQEWSRPVPELTSEQASWLEAQMWKGNVRELRNALERALLLGSDGGLLFSDMTDVSSLESLNLAEASRIFEKRHIERVINNCAGDKAQAADQLDIGLSTLYRKLEG
ncbi:sigma-54-dependent Fis family transcriptional regulator [bacterium AH-315-I20]|nr:sigma-54-dependent Fis family transcriptional regulator [bacterium AH-315-I20]